MSKLTANRFALVIVGTLLFALAWANFFYLPARSKAIVALAGLNSLEQDVTSAQSFLEQASSLGNRIDSLQERRSSLLSAVYSSDSLDAFIDRVTALIEAFNNQNVDISPDLNGLLTATRLDVFQSHLIVVSFTVHCQGRYVPLGRAMEILQQQPFCAGISHVGLTFNEGTNPDVLCDFRFSAYLREEGK